MGLKPATASQLGGRPRIFSDDDVFDAVARVVAREGFSRFSLLAVTRELNCSRQTLIHRFGTRGTLLRDYFDRNLALTRERFRSVRSLHSSPLEALRARLIIPSDERPDEIGDGKMLAGQLAFVLEAAHDEELRPLVKQAYDLWVGEYAQLIAAAVAAGELTPCDPNQLAEQLFATAFGAAAHYVGIGNSGSIVEALEWAFGVTFAPWINGRAKP